MDRITPLGRAILEVLDTHEHGVVDTEIGCSVSNQCGKIYSQDELRAKIIDLQFAELISVRFPEAPLDRGFSVDTMIYSITEAGCEALWALMRADTVCAVKRWAEEPHKEHLLPHPVHFESRAAMREYLRGAA